ncbi:hypothetical protein BDV28DRAFT_149204 [Aspergillus coremiiformis]|uniref:Uncharacterized protein n=1 Tax=Aspergillus coremiiformis TaxID=138285 RepID=A0A5N6Z583_9EURO|nr:hypothetical protein BDV28DRAFT_149204 [Aspergillus coremiiformis]
MAAVIEPHLLWVLVVGVIVWFVAKSFSQVTDEVAAWLRVRVRLWLDRRWPLPAESRLETGPGGGQSTGGEQSPSVVTSSPDSPGNGWLVQTAIRVSKWLEDIRRPSSVPRRGGDVEAAPRRSGRDSRGSDSPCPAAGVERARTDQPVTGGGAGDMNAIVSAVGALAGNDPAGSQIDTSA